MRLLYLVFTLVIGRRSVFGANTKDSVYEIPCKKSNSNFNDCVSRGLETAIRNFGNDNNQLRILHLDPFTVETIHAEHTIGSLNIDQKFSHVKVTGFSNSEVSMMRMDMDKCQIYFETITPSLTTEAEFRISGHFYLLPILGEGPSTVKIKNLKAIHNITCTRYMKKGIEHLLLTSYKIDFKPQSVTYKFENILDENSQLNDEVHNLFNTNSLAIFDQGRPAIQDAFEVVFLKIVNKMLAKTPLSTMFQE